MKWFSFWSRLIECGPMAIPASMMATTLETWNRLAIWGMIAISAVRITSISRYVILSMGVPSLPGSRDRQRRRIRALPNREAALYRFTEGNGKMAFSQIRDRSGKIIFNGIKGDINQGGTVERIRISAG